MQCVLMSNGSKCSYILDLDKYEENEEITLVDFISFASKEFKLNDIKIYKVENESSTDRSTIIDDSDDLINALNDESTTYFLIDGTPIFQVLVDLSQCGGGGDNELSVSIKKCDFCDEEGWNNSWQDLCQDIGNELKNDEWENKNELIDVKNEISITKLTQFIDVFKNANKSQNKVAKFSVQVKLSFLEKNS